MKFRSLYREGAKFRPLYKEVSLPHLTGAKLLSQRNQLLENFIAFSRGSKISLPPRGDNELVFNTYFILIFFPISILHAS